jgi:hypothetical protein
MGKAEDKRAAIVAAQAEREAAERAARGISPTTTARKPKPKWAARRGRPPRPQD